MTAHLRQRMHRDEDGLTLAEMLLTVALLGIVLAMAAQSAFGLFTATAKVEERNVNADQSRLAVAAVSRALRAAAPPPASATGVELPAFELLQADRVRFYANLGETATSGNIEDRIVARRVEYRVTGAQLLETVTDPVVTTSGVTYPGAGRTRVVAEHVRNPAATPVFTYHRDNGSQITLPASAAALHDVTSVRITILTSRDQGQITPAQRVSTEVRVASAWLGDGGTE